MKTAEEYTSLASECAEVADNNRDSVWKLAFAATAQAYAQLAIAAATLEAKSTERTKPTNVITWFKYEEIKPPTKGRYLVVDGYGSIQLFVWEPIRTDWHYITHWAYLPPLPDEVTK